MAVTWQKDLFAEQRLKDFGLKYAEEEVPLSKIDFEASRHNHARLIDPIDNELVDEYAAAQARGDAFPMLVLAKRPGKGFLILSGNHRGLAAKKNGVPVKAYIVSGDDAKALDVLPRVLNRGHGKRQERNEALEHACYAVTKYGYTQTEAANLFGLSNSLISVEMRMRDLRGQLAQRGIDVTSLGKQVLAKLAALPNANIQEAAARLLAALKIKSKDVFGPMIDEAKRCRTEASQLAVIDKWREQLGEPDEADAPYKRPLRTQFLRLLGGLENLINGKTTLAAVQITSASEADAVAERCRAVAAKVAALGGAGAAGAKGHRRRAR